ncbi:collagen alpha-2(I) chain-like [Planococcus citri]|uniref:collagen alpha-2(I) chain-like n=1 Tax=Planococcus citri TaxID=170843 RepID=UPI0031F7AFC0
MHTFFNIVFVKLIIISVQINIILLAQEEPTPTASAKNLNSGKNSTQFSTCVDILKKDTTIKNGWFWINPGNDYEDKPFKVWCDFHRNETCVFPQLSSLVSVPVNVACSPEEIWMGTMGQKISYPFDNSQKRVLQETSRLCHQNISIYCKNLVAFHDATQRTFDKSVKILAWNDVELTPLGPYTLRLKAVRDDCKYRDNSNEWKKTVIKYSTNRCDRLPFTDVAIRDGGRRGLGQWFYVQVAPVCFSW